MLKKIEWGLSDEKDAVDHSSPCNNDNPGLKKKTTLCGLKKDGPFYFLLQGQLSGARAQRLTEKAGFGTVVLPNQKSELTLSALVYFNLCCNPLMIN